MIRKGAYNRRSTKTAKYKKTFSPVGGKDEFFGLQYLADQFNQLRTPEKLTSEEHKAWDLAERVASGVVAHPQRRQRELTTILTRDLPPSLETAIALFNNYFENALVRLCLWPPKKGCGLEVLPGIEAPRDSRAPLIAEVASYLWWHFFHDEGWKRMHRCRVCEKWIVARGRNKVIRYCPGCSPDKYWTSERRRQSPKFGKRKKRKKGVQQ